MWAASKQDETLAKLSLLNGYRDFMEYLRGVSDGGAEGIRTPDPHNAIVVLYQLSYDPIQPERAM